METEIEAQFIDVDPKTIRVTLSSIGAKCIHKERLMRSKVYEHPTKKDADWFRVRDEGDKVTMSYKKLVDRSLHGTKEISFEVPDFESACVFLEKCHLDFISFQEKKRETWKYKNSKIEIDTWPWIPTFIEIESRTEKEIKKVARELGLEWEKAFHGSVEDIYQVYFNVTEEEVDDWPEIVFSPLPEWLEEKKR